MNEGNVLKEIIDDYFDRVTTKIIQSKITWSPENFDQWPPFSVKNRITLVQTHEASSLHLITETDHDDCYYRTAYKVRKFRFYVNASILSTRTNHSDVIVYGNWFKCNSNMPPDTYSESGAEKIKKLALDEVEKTRLEIDHLDFKAFET